MDGIEANDCIIPRPQPIGVLPLPAGLLIVGPGREADVVRLQLCAGRLPNRWPDSLRYIDRALRGDIERALDAIRADDPISQVNRFVLRPSRQQLDVLDELHRLGRLPLPLQAVTAAVAHTAGLVNGPPALGDHDGEFSALIHLTRAVDHLERGRHDDAAWELSQGAAAARPSAPILSVQLLCSLSDLLHHVERHSTFALGHDAAHHPPFLAHGESLLGLWVEQVRSMQRN